MGVDAVMAFGTEQELSNDDVRRLSYELGNCFGGKVMNWHPDGQYTYGAPRRCITPMLNEGEDARWLLAGDPGDLNYYEVSLSGRFYGEGYTRGDLPTYIAIANWLDVRLPGCCVWYGGDSGDSLEGFSAPARAALWRHFVWHGNRAYAQAFDRDKDSHPVPECALCAEPMNRNWWGSSFALYTCLGCWHEVVSRDGGKTWVPGWKDREQEEKRRGAANG